VLRSCINPRTSPPIILRVSGGTSIIGEDLSHEGITTSIQEILRLNVAAVGAELGAQVVKTYWCEDFDKVVNGCPVPVVMAGGPKCETEREVFEFVYDGVEKGAIGLNLGRNVWQHEHPVAMMKALRAIIHENASVEEASDLFNSLRGE